ncbi:putative nucleic acid-binding protein [Cricetibacter osteomyelitidis]|uniref:Putative nucleic acid-binding protein n=1 Tax=Cricetibacter osteomyelitidis TaxID=1521931 RepID=A0A4R2SZH2_9PAST|nr:PIN domain-containing protein [Cricetibacter osteomyelitidis]TCP95969.1 putative nucleic acid-binding protein [Cricetibacter osteomyelitidis]
MTIKKILLDTNILVSAINDAQSQERIQLEELLQDENTLLYTTPLIKHEVLRFYKIIDENRQYSTAKAILDLLKNLDIDERISAIATDIVRFERQKYPERYQPNIDGNQKKIDKYNFDIMHIATAKQNKLEIKSNDGDVIYKYERLYDEMKCNTKIPNPS